MKKFFKICTVLLFFFAVWWNILLSRHQYLMYNESGEEEVLVLYRSGVPLEFVSIDPDLWDYPSSNAMNEPEIRSIYKLLLVKLFLPKMGDGNQIVVQRFGGGDYAAVPLYRNGSYAVLSYSMLSNITLVGRFFIVAVIATYFKDALAFLKDFFNVVKHSFGKLKERLRKKEKQE